MLKNGSELERVLKALGKGSPKVFEGERQNEKIVVVENSRKEEMNDVVIDILVRVE